VVGGGMTREQRYHRALGGSPETWSAIEREEKIDRAIAAFNFNPPFDDFYGHKVAHHARRPILATDCDYEIVTVSGVQGRRIEA
jgi:hypothetical protein